jgi:Kef-type K+ transport system membrane component KefB
MSDSTSPTTSERQQPRPARTWGLYAFTLVAAAVALLWIREHGSLIAAQASLASGTLRLKSETPKLLMQVLLALGVIVISARCAGALFSRMLGQPAVVGEIVAGLTLGPSVLGAIAPGVATLLFPPAVLAQLSTIANIGMVLFMFLVGLELDLVKLRRESHGTLLVAHAGILVSLVLGGFLALYLYTSYAPPGVGFDVFALFVGTSLSVTAFPVLARIVQERRMQSTKVGLTALVSAAIDDATAWCLLAFVCGLAGSRLDGAKTTVVLALAYVALMLLVVRPLAQRWVKRIEGRGAHATLMTQAIVFTGLLLSAAATEWIGIHALFGAFFFGAVLPSEGLLAERTQTHLHDTVTVLFLPIVFMIAGMRADIGLIAHPREVAVCALIIGVAIVGKLGGGAVASRLVGFRWRESLIVGILMNTRGLMELIVVQIGLELGVISRSLYTMLVIMALVTTFLTTPLLRLMREGFESRRSARSEPEPLLRASADPANHAS